MDILGNIILNTVVLSFMYIIMALGFAFVFNMMGALNFAHGAFVMISAFLCYYIIRWTGASNWTALVITAIIMALIGVLMERAVFRPFMNNINGGIMIAVAIITIAQTVFSIYTGTLDIIIESFLKGRTFVFGVPTSNEKLLILFIGLGLLIAVLILVNKTALGRQMEAIAQDRVAAALQGININRVSAIVCAIGLVLAAVAGSLMGSIRQITPTMGDEMLTRILMVVMLAGAGSRSMNGLIVTGFLLGFLDSFLPIYVQGASASAVTAVFVLVLILIKPTGLFGHELKEGA